MSDNYEDNVVPENTALVGEGSSASRVSFQLLQSIYSELTGKSETLNKLFNVPYQFGASDIEELFHILRQTCEQYSVTAENVNIKLYHEDDSHERLSSFERYRMLSASSNSPVHIFEMTYNFLLIPSKGQHPQSYKVEIRLYSKMSLMRKLRESAERVPSELLEIFGGPTASVEIEYVDYVVARSFLAAIDHWIKGVKQYTPPRWISVLRLMKSMVPKIMKYFTAALVIGLVTLLIPHYLSGGSGAVELTYFWLLSGVAIFSMFRLADFFGKKIASAVNGWHDLSFVCLNKGDQREVEEVMGGNRRSTFRVLFGVIANLVLAILASVIASLLLNN